MRPDTVVVYHEAPGIPPVLVDGGGDGGGLVELFALDALAPLDDAAILFGTAWQDDCMAMPSFWRSSSKVPRNSAPMSIWTLE